MNMRKVKKLLNTFKSKTMFESIEILLSHKVNLTRQLRKYINNFFNVCRNTSVNLQ